MGKTGIESGSAVRPTRRSIRAMTVQHCKRTFCVRSGSLRHAWHVAGTLSNQRNNRTRSRIVHNYFGPQWRVCRECSHQSNGHNQQNQRQANPRKQTKKSDIFMEIDTTKTAACHMKSLLVTKGNAILDAGTKRAHKVGFRVSRRIKKNHI